MKRIHRGDTKVRCRCQLSALGGQPEELHRSPPVGTPPNLQRSPLNTRRPRSSPYLRVSVVNLLLLVALMTLAEGCSPTTPSPQPKNAHRHVHGDEHEHEHEMTHEEEHGILPHKPHTFEEAVVEIERRGRAMLESQDRYDSQATEWFDILSWLPELAADTDLKREDWEQVVRVAIDLEVWSASWKPAVSSGEVPDAVQFESLTVALRQVVSRIPAPY